MEIRRLNSNDYDELLELLNGVFANKYGRAMDFLSEQPKMWRRDDECMGKHIAVFEDGRMVSVVGIYPLPVVIGGQRLLFATTGNVATLPEYEGRGYFTKLFSMAMDEVERMGVDAARLGGARQRYAKYGFEPAGLCFKIELNSDNVNKFFKGYGENVSFERITPEDKCALEYVSMLIKKKDFFVERKQEDIYSLIGTKHSAPYIAKRDGAPIGYLSASCDNQFVGVGEFGRNINEYGYESSEDFFHMISAYQKKVGNVLNLTVAPHETDILEKISDGAEYVNLVSPSRFRILNFEKLIDALVKLKDKSEGLPYAKCVIEIEDYGKVLLYREENGVGATLSSDAPEIVLSRAEATRLLFGHLPCFATKKIPENLKKFLPLPLSWNTLDYL